MVDDFIEVYKKYASDKFCDDLINSFTHALKGKAEIVPHSTPFRNDYCILLDLILESGILFNGLDLTKETNSILDRASIEYREKYNVSLGTINYASWRIQLQKTPIGGGFHNWHFETMNLETSHRILVWTIYLNTMPEGEGETEFIYYHKRIRPSKGDVIIFPAAFTHTHRGNPPLTMEKYIATGWWSIM